jgi:hypothetical protein
VKLVVVVQHGTFGDTCSFGVIVFGEDISDKGNHFLNKMSKVGPK